MGRIERIKSMERRLEQVDAALKRIADALDDYAAACYPDLAAFSDSIASSSVAASSQSAV